MAPRRGHTLALTLALACCLAVSPAAPAPGATTFEAAPAEKAAAPPAAAPAAPATAPASATPAGAAPVRAAAPPAGAAASPASPASGEQAKQEVASAYKTNPRPPSQEPYTEGALEPLNTAMVPRGTLAVTLPNAAQQHQMELASVLHPEFKMLPHIKVFDMIPKPDPNEKKPVEHKARKVNAWPVETTDPKFLMTKAAWPSAPVWMVKPGDLGKIDHNAHLEEDASVVAAVPQSGMWGTQGVYGAFGSLLQLRNRKRQQYWGRGCQYDLQREAFGKVVAKCGKLYGVSTARNEYLGCQAPLLHEAKDKIKKACCANTATDGCELANFGNYDANVADVGQR